jgi:hypothetical protein
VRLRFRGTAADGLVAIVRHTCTDDVLVIHRSMNAVDQQTRGGLFEHDTARAEMALSNSNGSIAAVNTLTRVASDLESWSTPGAVDACVDRSTQLHRRRLRMTLAYAVTNA